MLWLDVLELLIITITDLINVLALVSIKLSPFASSFSWSRHSETIENVTDSAHIYTKDK